MTKFWEFLRNFQRNIPKKFSGIFWGKISEKFLGITQDYVFYSVPQIIRKKSWIFLRNFRRNIPKKFSGISREKFWRNSQEFLETKSQNYDPQKISQLGNQFRGISREFPRNHSQELVLEKALYEIYAKSEMVISIIVKNWTASVLQLHDPIRYMYMCMYSICIWTVQSGLPSVKHWD